MTAVPDEFDPVAEQEGPFVEALICERVIQETDGVLTIVRLIDQVNLERPPTPLLPLIPAPFQAAVLVVLKGGKPGAKHSVEVIVHAPSGIATQVAAQTVELASRFPRGIAGANLILQMKMGLKDDGTYWFEVRLDGKRATATPLRVAFAEPGTLTEPRPSEPDSPNR
jgi:hypothetical protein